MVFENVFAHSFLYVALCTFALGFFGLLIVGGVLWKSNVHLSQYEGWKRLLFPSLVCGLTTSFFLTIVILTIVPSLITIDEDLNYSEELSFFSNGEFIGIGGSYIANNSDRTLKLVGVGEDQDVNVIIPSKDIRKIRICPDVYFQEVPKEQFVRVDYSRGKRRIVSGPSVYLIEYKNN